MRVAMVCPYSLSRPGGVQGQALGLSRALRALGHEVTVLAPDDRHPVGTSDQGVVVVGHSTGVRANGSVAPLALSPGAAVRTGRFIRDHGVDLVHLHEPMAPTVGYDALLRADRPMIATFHRSGDSRWYRALAPLARWATAGLDVRCAVSEAARSTAEAAVGGDYEVLFNGVEVARFANAAPVPKDRPTALFLGRHEERKGLGVLLEAFEHVPGRVQLRVAGEGPGTEALRRRHPPSGRLDWLGLLTEVEVAAQLAGSDVLCAPSLRGESFGVVLLEGMAAGCAVVASDLPGYRSASGGHAVLVPPGDAAALAAALGRALAGAETASGQSAPTARRAALGHAEGWSMERLATCYVDLYRRAAAHRVARGAR